jgi:hypothetical protein
MAWRSILSEVVIKNMKKRAAVRGIAKYNFFA